MTFAETDATETELATENTTFTPSVFLDGKVSLYGGDSREVLRGLPIKDQWLVRRGLFGRLLTTARYLAALTIMSRGGADRYTATSPIRTSVMSDRDTEGVFGPTDRPSGTLWKRKP